MDEKAPGMNRDERLAQKLRQNLHRRKAQARAMAEGAAGGTTEGAEDTDSALPKAPEGR